jgi:hypothetical protein
VAVFVSYRRRDTAHAAGRLQAWLADRIAPTPVFLDLDVAAGEDFVAAIEDAVGRCAVLLALIGPRWLTITDSQGRRRLNDPRDWVALEIRTALARRIRVVPVLVDGAAMPVALELPPALEGVTRRSAMPLEHATFEHDARRLLEVVQEALRSAPDSGAASVTDAERRAAEAGDTAAMDTLALLLAAGGAQAEAEQWWRRAAEAGHPRAMTSLAVLLRDREETADAERWLRRALERGDVSAAYEYGVLLEQLRLPVPMEDMYRRAAGVGHPGAMFRLGLVLRARDREEAESWLRRAAEAGHVDAMIALGIMLEESGRFVAAANAFGPAAEAGNAAAMHKLGDVLYQLDGNTTARAEHWWRRAADVRSRRGARPS